MKVLVDTSVWIDHLHQDDALLCRFLSDGIVFIANPILGELSAGNIPSRQRTMSDLRLLQRFADPEGEDALDWIEQRHLSGKGLSWIDCLLLFIAEQNGAHVYTHDRILARHAEALKLALTR